MSEDHIHKHPAYADALEDWVLMRDAYRGQRAVKSKDTTYLPMTASQIIDGGLASVQSIGYQAYLNYKKRARFPNFVREAIQTAIGMMHSQPAEIELPAAMEGIKSRTGEDLQVILRRINTEQLLTGRVGLMLDMPQETIPGEDLPYLAIYSAERIINWDDGRVEQLVPQNLNLVILDESEYERQEGFDWMVENKYRFLSLGALKENVPVGTYTHGVFESFDEYSDENMRVPVWRGRTLDKIPFIIINSCDVNADVDDPPLMDLGNACMTIYQGEADYRQNLHFQGQDTLVTTGAGFDEDDTVRVGTGARIDLPMGAKAEYIGVDGAGLEEQRIALGNLESRAGTMGAQSLDSTSRERESGDSLRIRMAARTADMNQIADTGALGLETMLKMCAEWIGENPDEVKVHPNKEFGEMPLTGQTMVEIATARNLGWPISAKSMHDLARKRRMTTKTFEEEVEEAQKEDDEEDFVFAKQGSGDQAAIQPNDPSDPAGQNQVPGQTNNPSGRDT